MAVSGQIDERLRGFTAHVRGYAITTLTADGRIYTWNEGAQYVKGYAADEIVGEPYERFFGPDDVAAGRPRQILAAAREHGAYEEEGWRVRKDGSRFWAHILMTAIYDEDGEVVGFGKITEDRTEHKEAEENLRARMEELARSNHELEQFAYVTSHDLSEPLRSITGYADVLVRRHADDLGPDGARFLQKIVHSGTRMQGLIDDLLAYSRAGRRGLEAQDVDVEELVGEITEALAASIVERDGRVDVKPMPRVRADRTLLGQILQNLIANGLKFSEGPPTVEVSARETATGYEIAVADHGIGIADEHKERVFELFKRLHGREDYAGTGVGLAICRRIAQRHGGDLHVTDRPGGGTVFTITLPKEAP